MKTSVATKTYINRTIDRLYGILEGITIDCRINDKEIIALNDWVETHEILTGFEPFKGLVSLLRDILDDDIIEPHERECLLEWCADTLNEKGFCNDFTPAIRRLHGIMHGIVCDDQITISEIKSLKDWLLDHEHLEEWWPFNDLTKLLDRVLADNIIDSDEQKELEIFFKDFSEIPLEHMTIRDKEYKTNPHMLTPAPVFKPISSICEKKPTIEFKNKKFCFTGPAIAGQRKELEEMVLHFGGTSHTNLIQSVDYLIIGGQSSPAWVYSTYGRKIEKAIRWKKKGKKLGIIQEVDFLDAVQSQN